MKQPLLLAAIAPAIVQATHPSRATSVVTIAQTIYETATNVVRVTANASVVAERFSHGPSVCNTTVSVDADTVFLTTKLTTFTTSTVTDVFTPPVINVTTTSAALSTSIAPVPRASSEVSSTQTTTRVITKTFSFLPASETLSSFNSTDRTCMGNLSMTYSAGGNATYKSGPTSWCPVSSNTAVTSRSPIATINIGDIQNVPSPSYTPQNLTDIAFPTSSAERLKPQALFAAIVQMFYYITSAYAQTSSATSCLSTCVVPTVWAVIAPPAPACDATVNSQATSTPPNPTSSCPSEVEAVFHKSRSAAIIAPVACCNTANLCDMSTTKGSSCWLGPTRRCCTTPRVESTVTDIDVAPIYGEPASVVILTSTTTFEVIATAVSISDEQTSRSSAAASIAPPPSSATQPITLESHNGPVGSSAHEQSKSQTSVDTVLSSSDTGNLSTSVSSSMASNKVSTATIPQFIPVTEFGKLNSSSADTAGVYSVWWNSSLNVTVTTTMTTTGNATTATTTTIANGTTTVTEHDRLTTTAVPHFDGPDLGDNGTTNGGVRLRNPFKIF